MYLKQEIEKYDILKVINNQEGIWEDMTEFIYF